MDTNGGRSVSTHAVSRRAFYFGVSFAIVSPVVQYTLVVSTAMARGTLWPEARVVGCPPRWGPSSRLPPSSVVQYTLVESTAMPHRLPWPEARVTGVPPTMGTSSPFPPFAFVQYTLVASTAMAERWFWPEARVVGCPRGGDLHHGAVLIGRPVDSGGVHCDAQGVGLA